MRRLHVLNGDSTAAVFAHAGIEGDTLVWRDILCEGPVTAAMQAPAARAEYLGRYLEIDPAHYVGAWHAAHAALAAAGDHDEIVLWFEQDLFCAVNLWYLLGCLAHARGLIALVYPALGDVRGLGTAEPRRLAELFAAREPLSAAATARARRAWRAYASPTPMAVQAEARAGDGGLPFVQAALRRHLARLPALATGLSEIEEAALQELVAGPLGFAELFVAVTTREPLRRHGMGDLQLAAIVRALGSGTRPLVSIDGEALGACRQWRVHITGETHAALTGERPWAPPARWIGGLHLEGADRHWRRDGDRIVHAA